MHVTRLDPNDPEWLAWREKARQATAEICARVAKGEPLPEVDDKLYKGAMDYLLALTHGKCVYCESDIRTTHPGDVEHYRPKRGVRDESGKIVKIKNGNAEIDHPGYWWLAYEWTNLLPSCIDCNRIRKHEEEKGGKGELFPVRGFRAANPGEESKEEPLLLNPADRDPAEHLEFLENGMIKPKTDIGAASCKILGLNIRESLVRARAARFRDARAALMMAVVSLMNTFVSKAPRSQGETETRKELNDMWYGNTPYGACASLALHQAIETMAQAGFSARFPLDV